MYRKPVFVYIDIQSPVYNYCSHGYITIGKLVEVYRYWESLHEYEQYIVKPLYYVTAAVT